MLKAHKINAYPIGRNSAYMLQINARPNIGLSGVSNFRIYGLHQFSWLTQFCHCCAFRLSSHSHGKMISITVADQVLILWMYSNKHLPNLNNSGNVATCDKRHVLQMYHFQHFI